MWYAVPMGMRFTLLASMALTVLCAGCAPRAGAAHRTVDGLRQRGELLDERTEGRETILLIREGNEVVKWRVVDHAEGKLGGASTQAVGTVETVTRTCYAGDAEIPCQHLQRDPDLGPFISWLPPVGDGTGEPIPPPAAPPAPPAPRGTPAAPPPPSPPAPE